VYDIAISYNITIVSRCSSKRSSWYWHAGFFRCIYTVLKGNSDNYKNTGRLLPLKICRTLDLAIRQVDRVVNKTHRWSRSSLLTIVGRTTNRPSQPPSFALIFNPLTGYDHDRVGQKRYRKLMATIILSNLNRFSQFFYRKVLWYICSKLVKNPTTPCICCHTTL